MGGSGWIAIVLALAACGRLGFDPSAGSSGGSGDAGLAGPGVIVGLVGDGTGRVVSNPPGIACPGTCSAEFPIGTVVTMTSLADAGSTFTSWGGVCPGGASCQVTVTSTEQVLAQFLLPRNYVFVTATTIVPGSLGTLQAADAECMARAAASGVPAGTYRAWVSSSTENARDRLGAARGWLRLDQKPFADTIDDLVAGRAYHPIGLYDNGVAIPQYTTVVTGSSRGVVAENCGNFSTTTGSVATSNPLAVIDGFDRYTTSPCSAGAHLYCFGIDNQRQVEAVPATGRLAFVTASDWIVGGGFAAADAFCQAEADAAGVTGTFHALLAGSSANAASRFDTNGPTWVRADGVPLATTATDVMAGNVRAPLDVTLAGTYTAPEIWTGATLQPPNGATTNTDTCADWTDTVGTKLGADTIAMFSGTYFFGASGAITCTQPVRHLYCLQQ